MKVDSIKERLLCHAAGFYGSRLSNSALTEWQSAEDLMRSSLKDAQKMIDIIYDDEKLKEFLK